jgi:SAM-dependent methyltransferase
MPLDERKMANLAQWDESVPYHVASDFYRVEAFKAGRCKLDAIDVEQLGDVRGKTLLHLQCHFGLDTLSWARRGATVTGVDFSPAAIAAARKLSEETGVPGTFVETELYDAPAALEEQFDVVFTGCGALCWLPDIRRWAGVVASCLKPGGTFYIREAHPVLWSLDDVETDGVLRIRFPYFEREEANRWEDARDYADPEALLKNTVTYEWNHGLGEIVTSLIEAGLRIEYVREHPFCAWKALPQMVEGEDHSWRLPENPERLPLMYSIRAVK